MLPKSPRNWNAVRKPLEVQLCAARYHKLCPLWSTLPSSVPLWECVRFFCAFLWWCVNAVWQLHQITDVKVQWICNKFCFKLSKMAPKTHSMLEEAFGDNALCHTQTCKWFKRFKNGWMSVTDEQCSWQPSTEPQPKMWQKFGNEGIWHKEFVPPRQTVNGKFYCGVLRQMTDNIRHKHPDKWRNNSSALHHDNTPNSCIARCVEVFGFYEDDGHPPASLLTGPRPMIFFYSQRYNWSSRGNVLAAMKRFKAKSQDMTKTLHCFQSWKSHWDHCINAEGGYCEGDGSDRNFVNWLS